MMLCGTATDHSPPWLSNRFATISSETRLACPYGLAGARVWSSRYGAGTSPYLAIEEPWTNLPTPFETAALAQSTVACAVLRNKKEGENTLSPSYAAAAQW